MWCKSEVEVDLFGVGISILRHEFILISLLWSFRGWSAAKSVCPRLWRKTLGSETLQDELLYSPSLSFLHLWVRNNMEWGFCEVGLIKLCPAPDFGIEIEMQGTLNRIKELVMLFCWVCVIVSWIGWRVLISRAIKSIVWAFPTPISGQLTEEASSGICVSPSCLGRGTLGNSGAENRLRLWRWQWWSVVLWSALLMLWVLPTHVNSEISCPISDLWNVSTPWEAGINPMSR